jgi:biotin transport system permease protein
MAVAPLLAPTPRDGLGRTLLALDARPKLAFALLVGMVLWQLPLLILFFLTLFGGASCRALGGFTRANRILWRMGFLFVLVWSGLKCGLDIWAGADLLAGLGAGAELGIRLATLLLLGFTLTLSTSPRRLGLGLAWYLRPVLGSRAWKTALALSLMIHFLPLGLAAVGGLRQGLSMRWPDCPWPTRLRLIPLALLRVLSQTTWTQTLAVAARNLDKPEAWQPERAVRLGEWVVALIPIMFIGLALVALH